MPTYEYRCETCDLVFDVQQAFTDPTLAKCPTKKSGQSPAGCERPGRGRVAKVFSAPGITFKGGGFYKTDSRGSSGNGSKSASADSGSSTGSSTGDSGSTTASSSSPD